MHIIEEVDGDGGIIKLQKPIVKMKDDKWYSTFTSIIEGLKSLVYKLRHQS